MKRHRANVQTDHTETAFLIAASAAGAGIIGSEIIYSAATDVAFWDTWRLHPLSIFVGTASFIGCLYCMQVLNRRKSPMRYLGPYTPLLGASGINLVLKQNSLWLIPFAVIGVLWSMFQVHTSRR
jgi:uncharacterized membrane protein YgdD (TMEM256/DUF423 family)